MDVEELLKKIPTTRYQGSKRKILPWLYDCLEKYEFHSVLDAFGGSGVHVFILCSVFGLYLSHLNNPLRYANFLKKRFLKVYWTYAYIVILYSLWFICPI